MPYYDKICRSCGWLAIDVLERVHDVNVPCPTCGEPTERAWLTKPSSVVGDEMDHWQVNGTKTPIHFRSKLERKRWMKSQGLVEMVRHVGQGDTDKSTLTTRWSSMDPYTLENARILLERAAQEPAHNDPAPTPLNVRRTYGDVRFGPGGKRELVPHG